MVFIYGMIEYLSLKKVTEMHEEEILQGISDVVESGWYLQGTALKDFETNYAAYIGSRYCVGCGNGLDALSLILQAYRELGVLKDGDDVIVPANTYIATILSITQNNLHPILVEPRKDTLQLDDRLLENALTTRTKALMLVHLYGCCAYTEAIGRFCQQHHLKLIEDNAQAHGCCYGKLHTGNLGDAAAHSFYPGKILEPWEMLVRLLQMTKCWPIPFVLWAIMALPENMYFPIKVEIAEWTKCRHAF